MQSFFDGITVWAYNVLPAIFPFTVLTTLALKVRPKAKISFSKKLFCIDCDSVFIASLLCGYPIGAKIIGDSDASTITATKACAFCSSAGPIFMIGTVGAKLLQNTTATVILITVHFLSLIINGFIFPATIAVIVLNFMSKLNAQMSFSGVTALVKSVMKWVIGITVTVFSIFITMQSSATSLFDGIIFKATKYVVSNSVPMVGNFLSSGFDMLDTPALVT